MSEKNLLWNCRRGMKELDVAIERFMATRFDQLSNKQKEVFYEILKTDDGEFFAWLIDSYEPQNESYKEIVKMLQEGIK
ncbi:MAG: hypothetical protein D6B28_07530 [Gammaproteobacteria bacterium]|nr:MAG: hypothetical protein D6B28_07530 [Gammaproteobacteria bacterium]